MTQNTSDESVLKSITRLVNEEEQLYAKQPMDDRAVERVEELKVELDQCWDLLRQRRAKTDYGENPDEAEVRPVSEVEGYQS